MSWNIRKDKKSCHERKGEKKGYYGQEKKVAVEDKKALLKTMLDKGKKKNYYGRMTTKERNKCCDRRKGERKLLCKNKKRVV